jgi:ATP-binding cassette subfamily B protein
MSAKTRAAAQAADAPAADVAATAAPAADTADTAAATSAAATAAAATKAAGQAAPNRKKAKTGIFRLLELAGQKAGMLVLSATVATVSSIILLAPFASVYFILAELLASAAEGRPTNGESIILWALAGLALLILGYVLFYVGGMVSHVAAFRILYGIRVRVAEHIGRLNMGFFNRTATGRIKKIIEVDVERIEIFIAHELPDLVSGCVMLAVMVAVMFTLNPWLALAALIPVLIGFIAQYSMLMGKKCKAATVEFFNALEEISSSSVQYVRGMPSIKVFGQTIYSFRRFFEDMTKYRDFCLYYSDGLQNSFALFKVMVSSLVSFILPVGVLLLSRDPDNIAFATTMILFLVFAPGLSQPLMKLISLANNLMVIGEGVRRIDAILAEPPLPEPLSPSAPLPQAASNQAPPRPTQAYDIVFEDVCFSYSEGPPPNPQPAGQPKATNPDADDTAIDVEDVRHSASTEVLHRVNLRAAQGQITALVGPSGSGKTTIAQLVCRFWNVGSGRISIGGVDIRDIHSDNLMDLVSFVFQDAFLFSDSILNNLLIGKPTASEDEVIAAAKAAQCHEFISALPEGYQTRIGEGGVYLSGGEMQRVCVARAILKDAPILILDEATAYADPENEHLMQQALGMLMRGKTVIIIAHRLSTIQHAQTIAVVKDGRVAELGSHQQLLAQDGLYARMWDAYTRATDWRIANAPATSGAASVPQASTSLTTSAAADAASEPQASRPMNANGGEQSC